MKPMGRPVKHDVAKDTPVCHKCGFVMVEEFDYRKINEMTELAIQTGCYVCLHCTRAVREETSRG